jgi:putative YhdH/YhfP family quinone oxidoreductase
MPADAGTPSGVDDQTSFPAFVVERQGDDVATGMRELTVDALPPGEILVAVAWSCVNYKDGMVTVAGNRVARTSPLVPGVDLAGTVVASEDASLPVGTAVLAHGHDIGVARHGGFAAYARLPADWVLPVPPGLTARQAMAIGTAGFTAALSVDELERHGLVPEDGPVLVTGAAGGVGSLSVALLAARGYEVVASTGRTQEAAWLTSLGAARVEGREALDQRLERVLGPELWAGAIDCVGGATLAKVLRTLRYGAAVAASGLTGGPELETTVFPFITRQVALFGIDSVETPAWRRAEVWGRLGGDLRPPDLEAFVEQEVALADVGAVLPRILRGGVRGRVLVRVGDD